MQSLKPSSTKVAFTYKLAEIEAVAAQLAPLLGHEVVLVYGAMGAGKTTFIKALCNVLGVADEVSSPTFALVNEYRDGHGAPVYHFDLYRLLDEEEALDFGVDEYLDSGHLCLVEWPDKIVKFLPRNFAVIVLKIVGQARQLHFYPGCTASSLTHLPIHD